MSCATKTIFHSLIFNNRKIEKPPVAYLFIFGLRVKSHRASDLRCLTAKFSDLLDVWMKILEPRWRQFSVFHRVLDILVAEIGLQRTSIDTVIREFVTASMTEQRRPKDVTSPDEYLAQLPAEEPAPADSEVLEVQP